MVVQFPSYCSTPLPSLSLPPSHHGIGWNEQPDNLSRFPLAARMLRQLMTTAVSCWAVILLCSRLPSEDVSSPQRTSGLEQLNHVTLAEARRTCIHSTLTCRCTHWYPCSYTHTHSLTRLFMTDIKNAKVLLYHVIATGTCFSTSWFPAHTLRMLSKSCTCINQSLKAAQGGCSTDGPTQNNADLI